MQQALDNPFQKRDYPMSEQNAHYWFQDKKALYEEVKRFDWFRPDIVGGKSIMWGRQSYRWTDIDFEANMKDGHGVDWPIRYKDIAPWYDYAEKWAGISGENLANYPTYPDGQLLPMMPMNVVEADVRKRIEAAFPNRRMTMGRVANLTQNHQSVVVRAIIGICVAVVVRSVRISVRKVRRCLRRWRQNG